MNPISDTSAGILSSPGVLCSPTILSSL